jgi:hypothetical protein
LIHHQIMTVTWYLLSTKLFHLEYDESELLNEWLIHEYVMQCTKFDRMKSWRDTLDHMIILMLPIKHIE